MNPIIDIRQHNGAPCIHVNGEPHNGLAFWHAPDESGIEEWQLFARCGIHLFQVDTSLWPADIDGDDPTSAWDGIIEVLLKADPQAKAWIRLWTEPSAAWLRAHPDDVQVHIDQHNGDKFSWRVAYSSKLWRQETAERLKRFVSYMEKRWGDKVWVYQLNAGDCGEWAYAWKPVVSGYAPVQISAWRDWLRGQYGDETVLQNAWNQPNATFTTAKPPTWQDRTRGETWPPASHLIDPVQERSMVDWLNFHGYTQADALAELATATRNALNEVASTKLISAFHGYHIWPYGSAYGACNTGFSDLNPVLNSPNIDVICTPLAYIHRNPGGVYSHHDLAASIRLHGKIFYAEDDTFTHHANWTPWRYCCQNATETVQILRRNISGALADGGCQWWMDHDGGNWYCDDETEAGVAGMLQIADAALTRQRGSCAEIAFLTNEESFRILKQDDALIDILWPRQQTELMRIGTPVDFVRVADLALAEQNGDASRWKMIIVAGCLWLDDAEKELMKRILMRDGKTLIFLHGQGISDGKRLDVELTSQLTGINLKTYPHGGPCRGETVLHETQFSWGTDKEISPILYADDPDADTIGWLERQYCPALVRKRQDNWISIWSGVPGLPAPLLGYFAEQAGAHRYMTDGSQVMANEGLLAVHATGDGERIISLPRMRHIVDAIYGDDLGIVSEIKLDLQRGDTRIWHLDEGVKRESEE
ncbi:MAG: hypothetical protein WCO98_05835 [bacterium]